MSWVAELLIAKLPCEQPQMDTRHVVLVICGVHVSNSFDQTFIELAEEQVEGGALK